MDSISSYGGFIKARTSTCVPIWRYFQGPNFVDWNIFREETLWAIAEISMPYPMHPYIFLLPAQNLRCFSFSTSDTCYLIGRIWIMMLHQSFSGDMCKTFFQLSLIGLFVGPAPKEGAIVAAKRQEGLICM